MHEMENVKQVYFFTTSLKKLLEMRSSKISVPHTMLWKYFTNWLA